MVNNNILSEAEERQIEKKFELIHNCDSEYVVNRLKRSKIVLMDIINICEHLIMNHDEMIEDIQHHEKLNDDFYKKPNYDEIKDDYQPIITKRRGKFNRLSKSLNRENKKIELAINRWLKEHDLLSNYMDYGSFDDEIKDEYQPAISKKLEEFNRLSNQEKKKIKLVMDKWSDEYDLLSNYMDYESFDDEIEDNSSAIDGLNQHQ